MMKISKGFPLVALILMPLLITIGWALLYSDQSDYKNLRYSCWKIGMCSMNLDTAVNAMVNDLDRTDLIRGKNLSQIEKKFGYVTTLENAYPYLRQIHDEQFKGKEVVFLRHSDLMVILENGRGVDLVYIKG